MSSTSAFLILLLLLPVLWITKSVLKHMGSKKREAPEASGAWPILGHLPLLGGPKPPHIILGDMADKYGPIFTIRLGVHRALVVSSSEIAKQCFTTNDIAFSNRPKMLASEAMGYNAMFGFSNCGHYWRQIRKITTLEILSNHRLQMLKHIRETEVKASLKEIYDLWDKNRDSDTSSNKVLVEMKRWFNDVTLNTVFKMVVGKRYVEEAMTPYEVEESERCRKALREFFRLSGVFAMGDLVPYLRWLDIGGHEKAMKNTAKELDKVLEGWLKEHKMKAESKQAKGDQQDFMDVMLSILKDEDLQSYEADTVNKATCLSMILGGSDTTTVTLTWALALLLDNREALKKAQQELDTCIGRERLVQESDLTNLVYLQAILKETLRLYPAGPLSAPHESLEDCTTGGYHVFAGTRLIVNLWKIHRDPNMWPTPDKFQPERFLTTHKNIDVRGHNFELIPFGSGRRVCPGISFALLTVQLILANLLHGFEITTPTDEAIDMTEAVGLTNLKVAPLQVLLTPRLPTHLYA